MRFETIAAFVLGIALPVAEVARRRTDFSDLPAYVDDFVIGALLLIAAIQSRRGRRAGPTLLVAAWGIFCGGAYYSFFGQLDRSTPADISGLPNSTVVAIKGALFAVGIVALLCSVRAASTSRTHTHPS